MDLEILITIISLAFEKPPFAILRQITLIPSKEPQEVKPEVVENV